MFTSRRFPSGVIPEHWHICDTSPAMSGKSDDALGLSRATAWNVWPAR